MTIRNLDTFYWVATLGSFRAAANHVHLTQPAISARIQVLEHDIGAKVFVRDTHSAELTSAGRELLPFAEKLMKLDQSVVQAFSNSANVEQSIRLGASETIASSWLPDFLSHYAKSRPKLSFDLTVDSTNNLRQALLSRDIDIGFLLGPLSESSMDNIELCQFEMIVAANPSIIDSQKIWTVEDLSLFPILTFSAQTRPYRQLKELLSASEHAAKITTSSSLGALVRLALSGFGIAVLPKAIVRSELEAGTLVRLPTDFVLPPISFTASYVANATTHDLAYEIADSAKGFITPKLINSVYQT